MITLELKNMLKYSLLCENLVFGDVFLSYFGSEVTVWAEY